MNNPLQGCLTVRELIEKLKKLDQDLPVLGRYEGRIRENEYYSLGIQLGDLDNQNTSGDPEFYGKGKCVLVGSG